MHAKTPRSATEPARSPFDGNSVVMVDHDVEVLRHASHLIEIGPGSGQDGGRVICQGTVSQLESDPASRIGPFLSGKQKVRVHQPAPASQVFDKGTIRLETGAIHTVHPLDVRIPKERLTVVTGVSGSGKTTMVLESLIAGLKAQLTGAPLPSHVHAIEAPGIERADLVDATPIGANVRSTVGTYSGVLDDLRREFAKLPAAKEQGLKVGDFSCNTGSLRCPTCDGSGQISLDVQFLPDVDIPCPACHGARYAKSAYAIEMEIGPVQNPVKRSLPQLLELTVDQALDALPHLPKTARKLQTLHDLGLGYLTLGESTPALSDGEAQRLKLASEMHRNQDKTLFVFDEPTIGLHPLDVAFLIGVLERLMDSGATVVVIEHDLDMMANADHIIDMGPGGGESGGRIVAAGTPAQIAENPASITGRYLAKIEQAQTGQPDVAAQADRRTSRPGQLACRWCSTFPWKRQPEPWMRASRKLSPATKSAVPMPV